MRGAVLPALVVLALAAAGCRQVDSAALGEKLLHPDTSEAAAAELAKTGSQAIPLLLKGTLSESPVVRKHSLAQLTVARTFTEHQPVVAERIIAMLGDQDPGVRAAAVEAVALYCRRRWDASMTTSMHRRNVDDMRPARPAMLDLLKDQNPDVRGTAAAKLAEICGHIANRDDVSALVTGLVSEDVRVRRGCAAALGAIGDPLAVDALFLCVSAAADTDAETALAAADGIYRCDPVPPKILVDSLESKYDSRRAAAALALGLLGDVRQISYPYGRLRPVALDALRRRRESERSEPVLREIHRAIQKIESAMRADGIVPPRPGDTE